MEEEKKNSGQTLGIAALITAIITFVIAVIPVSYTHLTLPTIYSF